MPGVSLTVVETGGGSDNIARMAKSEMHIGLLSASTGYQALHGVGEYAGKPAPDLRYLQWGR